MIRHQLECDKTTSYLDSAKRRSESALSLVGAGPLNTGLSGAGLELELATAGLVALAVSPLRALRASCDVRHRGLTLMNEIDG